MGPESRCSDSRQQPNRHPLGGGDSLPPKRRQNKTKGQILMNEASKMKLAQAEADAKADILAEADKLLADTPRATIEAKPAPTVETDGPQAGTHNGPVHDYSLYSIEKPPIVDTAKPIAELNRFAEWYAVHTGMKMARPLGIFLADPRHTRTDKFEHAQYGAKYMSKGKAPYMEVVVKTVKRNGKEVQVLETQAMDTLFVPPHLFGEEGQIGKDAKGRYLPVYEFIAHRQRHLGNAAEGIHDVGAKGYHNNDWVLSCDKESGLECLAGKDALLGYHETQFRTDFIKEIETHFKPDYTALNIVARYAQETVKAEADHKASKSAHPSTRIIWECPACKRTAQASPKPPLWCGCNTTKQSLGATPTKMKPKAKAGATAK